MAIVRPRLTDYYGIAARQEELHFAIPFLDEDIPLWVDPFLLWRSPSQQDNALHTSAINSFNHLGYLNRTNPFSAREMLVRISECDEVGLGSSHTKRGKRIGANAAKSILDLFGNIPEYDRRGFTHFEEIQFFVENIGKDRISDIFCNFVKSFLIDYTIQQCRELCIPMSTVSTGVYQYTTNTIKNEIVSLPVNPETKDGIILVPKHWLRYTPWINSDDFYSTFDQEQSDGHVIRSVLAYSRHDFDAVRAFVKKREASSEDCKNDPLFTQIPITSAKASLAAIRKLPTGIEDSSDKKFEREAARLLASLLYPQLDFATTQSRTEDGVLIRDLVFYNNKQQPFLADLWDTYNSRQIVFELKNVHEIQREHINQLNRYMTDEFGRFGVLLTRNRLKNAMLKNTTQLWSGQRRCIVAITDEDMELMVSAYESKQRDPIDVIKMKYAQFMRECPS
jgi:hypothetical protein